MSVRRRGRGPAATAAALWIVVTIAAALPAAALAQGAASPPASDAAAVRELPPVEVVGTTPLPGLGTPLRDIPANVQVFGAGALARQPLRTLAQFLEQNADSVGAAGAQGNAWQASLDFRGFDASPLLGAPQGLSVFQDGVRINEAFGDVVNWDLLPRSAIDTVELIPGSVAVFGLNTLGGALAIHTKRGARYPGVRASVAGGSFGARSVEVEAGGARGGFDAYLTAHAADERGWARHNPSRVRQLFAKGGYADGATDVQASLTFADNALEGTQTLPLSLSDDPRAAYTWPDRNDNHLAFFTLAGTRFLGAGLVLDANAYLRRYRSRNVSSNVNDDFDPQGDATMAHDDRATIAARTAGASVQVSSDLRLAGRRHRLSAGASLDAGDSRFTQDERPAFFTADRGTQALGPFGPVTDAALHNVAAGAFVADTVALDPAWTLTLSARYDRSRVRTADRSGGAPGLDASHAFARTNPAVGVTFNPAPQLTAYATWNQGMRAPTPIELTCADPQAPCKLPNEFLADPALAKVVARTAEAGARGKAGELAWSAAAYRTELRDDLQFVASGGGAANAGYFANVGRTRRQGAELAAAWTRGVWHVRVRYHHLDATFRSTFRAPSPNHSAADANGDIVVRSGNRLPGHPADAVKLRIDWAASPRLDLGLVLVAVGRQYARGDEDNADVHGPLPGHAVLHLDAEYRPLPRLTLFARVENLADRRYATYALLGSNAFTGPGGTFGPALGIAAVPDQFRAWAAPRALYAGVRYALDPEAAPPVAGGTAGGPAR